MTCRAVLNFQKMITVRGLLRHMTRQSQHVADTRAVTTINVPFCDEIYDSYK